MWFQTSRLTLTVSSVITLVCPSTFECLREAQIDSFMCVAVQTVPGESQQGYSRACSEHAAIGFQLGPPLKCCLWLTVSSFTFSQTTVYIQLNHKASVMTMQTNQMLQTPLFLGTQHMAVMWLQVEDRCWPTSESQKKTADRTCCEGVWLQNTASASVITPNYIVHTSVEQHNWTHIPISHIDYRQSYGNDYEVFGPRVHLVPGPITVRQTLG